MILIMIPEEGDYAIFFNERMQRLGILVEECKQIYDALRLRVFAEERPQSQTHRWSYICKHWFRTLHLTLSEL